MKTQGFASILRVLITLALSTLYVTTVGGAPQPISISHMGSQTIQLISHSPTQKASYNDPSQYGFSWHHRRRRRWVSHLCADQRRRGQVLGGQQLLANWATARPRTAPRRWT